MEMPFDNSMASLADWLFSGKLIERDPIVCAAPPGIVSTADLPPIVTAGPQGGWPRPLEEHA